MTGPSAGSDGEVFGESRQRFEELLDWLEGSGSAELTHAELENHVGTRGRELLRQMFQNHLDLRAQREQRVEVIDADGVSHRSVEAGHARPLATVFGTVAVERFAYRHRGCLNLHPADGALNLPTERHSHGLRLLAATEASRGSFDEAVEAIGRATGTGIGKRQVEALTTKAAADVEEFYATTAPEPATTSSDVLVISADGKGIVMRPDALRPATEKAAAKATTKLASRLSKGEKRNRKRMAEVGAVYDITPVPRSPTDILASNDSGPPPPAPTAQGKWVTASVVEDAAEVIAKVFDEAERRDPDHHRSWVALVDGNNHQINRIEAEAQARAITITIVIDLIHVLEYLWGAGWNFFAEGDPNVETWVHDKALAVLNGNARQQIVRILDGWPSEQALLDGYQRVALII